MPPNVPTPIFRTSTLTAIGTRAEKSNDAMTKRSTHLRIVK